MNHARALLTAATISSQSMYYKSMDITSQLTQLNALVKTVGSLPEGTLRTSLDACIKRRQIKRDLSLEALCVLEQDWDVDIEFLLGQVNIPEGEQV